ncbi:unnamed protein product [Rhizoctonia solani]|uniref:Cytochrome b5 heme-binding domain-containing protein n=1 Tax=Rhizoctonia solani TaxID=456999 RepID=A0A8H2WU92_9AGAM|nr:unnamed protein product [Rhizoctonia solani]
MSPGFFANYSATSIAVAAVAVIVPSYWLISRQGSHGQTTPAGPSTTKRTPFALPGQLQPPKHDPYTLAEASRLYISRTLINVRDVYGPGGSYSVFAGKDGSKGLGLSSLKAEDAVPDWSTLEEKERGVLNDWHAFFSKRYNVVGKVSDLPANVAPPTDES